jgi:hypothetical protein
LRLLKRKENKKNQLKFLVLKDKIKKDLGVEKIFKNPDTFFSLVKLLNNIILFCMKKLVLILKRERKEN